MPWCPQCKNEYREGITICADCGCELIEQEEQDRIGILFGDEKEMERLKGFLEYNNLTSAKVLFAEEENVYELSVSLKEKEAAMKAAKVYVQQEAERRAALYQQEEQMEEEAPEPVPSGLAYESNEQKARENKSSAIALLVSGSAGILFLVLSYAGVIPFQFRGFVYGVMGVLFFCFIIMGFVSMKNSKELNKKAEAENSLVDSITKWSLENLNADEIDKTIPAEETDESEKYFRRVQCMREKIQNQFLNLDESFLEHFIDDIYDDIFED